MKEKPPCEQIMTWLRLNLGVGALGALTGTDAKALTAAVHIMELYAYAGDESLLDAFRVVVLQMQPTTREFAYHTIAQVLNWSDRARLWSLAGLDDPILGHDVPKWRCAGDRTAPCL